MSGEQIRKALSECGITVAEFSRASEVSIPTLTKLLAGEHVRDKTRAKAVSALQLIKEQRKTAIKQILSGGKIAAG